MPGFGRGNPFGNYPFGHFDWSRTVLYRMLPELHKSKDAEEGYPLAKLVEGERPPFDRLRQKIQNFGELRDPLKVRSQYNESRFVTLGKKLITKGTVLQRGFNGSITAFGEFVSPSARFSPTHAGKELEISRSSNPANNQIVILAQIDAATPTRAVIAPPLSTDAGPLAWELREPSTEPDDRSVVEVFFGDVSDVVPGWTLFDGFSEFELLARTQLEGRTEREGADGFISGTSRTLTGAVSVVEGETTVTGVGTLFLTEVRAGGYVKLTAQVDASFTKVARVLTDTSLVLAGGYRDETGAGAASYEYHQLILSLNQLTLEDIGKKITISGAVEASNEDKFEITNVLRLHPSDSTYAGAITALTGTITVVNGFEGVSGVGTSFLTEVTPGGYIKLTADETSAYARVGAVASATALTLDSGYTGTSGAGSAQYTADPSFRLATIRRIGPSDSALKGTPIHNESGPLNWAILPKPRFTLRGRTQAVRGLVEQSGFDAAIVALGPREGATASIGTADASKLVAITGLTGMSSADIGRVITISGAALAENNGLFRIAAFVSATSVKYTNPAGVSDANNGAISWSVLPADQVDLRIPSGRFSPDLLGTAASITLVSGGSVTITGLVGMEPSCVGQTLAVSGALSPGNNSTAPFTISQYLSPSSVVYTNAAGVAADGNNGSISWRYNSPDRGKLMTLRGPGANNGTVEVESVAFNSITVAQRVTPQLGTPALPDLPNPFTLDAGPLEWELRSRTTLEGNAESPALQQVRVRAPSLLQYLAKDFGVDIDIRESEARQRSWVKNNGRWIGIKGHPNAYSILGAISGFDATAEALYRIAQDFLLVIPGEFVHEAGEYELGRSAPNPVHGAAPDPLYRDGSLDTEGARVRFRSPTAQFKLADIGLQIRIQHSTALENNKLYTIDQIAAGQPEPDGFIRAVLFRLVDTATTPDPTNGALAWNTARLYSTKPPLRPRFDDFDPEVMGQLINPPATLYLTGVSSAGDLLYTALLNGTFGNTIRVSHASTGSLSVTVVDTDISITFNAGVTTASAVVAAVAAHPQASLLVSATALNGGTGFLTPHSIANLTNGADHFSLDKFCWEEDFDGNIDGLLPYLAPGATTSGNILYTAAAGGDFGVRITHNPVALSPLAVVVTGTQIVVTYDPSVVTANDAVTAILNTPAAAAVVVPAAQAGGAGLLNSSLVSNVIFNIVGVVQTAENLWSVTISGPLNVIQDTQGGNWRMTDANGVDFFLESAPVASGANWVVTTFSAIEPAVGQLLFPGSPVSVTYDCSVIFTCDFCAASKILLTLEAGDVFEDSSSTEALELIVNRMLSRMEQVTPAHVQAIVSFSATLEASLDIQAEIEIGATEILPLIAPVQAYFDDVEGDIIPLDSLTLDSTVDDALFAFNNGAITGFVGSTATITGATLGPIPDVTGQNITITGAATSANNGTFVITGFTSGALVSTISYTNAAAVSPDANNGSITASTI